MYTFLFTVFFPLHCKKWYVYIMFYWHSLWRSEETSEHVYVLFGQWIQVFCMFISFVMDKVFTNKVTFDSIVEL